MTKDILTSYFLCIISELNIVNKLYPTVASPLQREQTIRGQGGENPAEGLDIAKG